MVARTKKEHRPSSINSIESTSLLPSVDQKNAVFDSQPPNQPKIFKLQLEVFIPHNSKFFWSFFWTQIISWDMRFSFWFVIFKKSSQKKRASSVFPLDFFSKVTLPSSYARAALNLPTKFLDCANYISPKKTHYDLKLGESSVQITLNRHSKVIENRCFISGRDAQYERYLGSNVCSRLTRILFRNTIFFKERVKKSVAHLCKEQLKTFRKENCIGNIIM